MLGTDTLTDEVTNISRHGLWFLLDDEGLLMPFDQFPWFRRATVEQLTLVERPTENHLYWPDLDVDLSVESIRTLALFPLVSGDAH